MTQNADARSGSFDIVGIFKSPFGDPDWLKKSLVMGLLMLIPIAGGLNVLGWSKAVYDRRKAGDTTLPDAGLHYMGPGGTIFFSIFLPMFLLLIVVAVLAAIITALGADGLAGLLGLALQIAYGVLAPAIVFLAIRDKDVVAGFRFGLLRQTIVGKGVVTYVMYALTLALASLFADAGMLVLCIGIFITTPLAAAIVGQAAASFDDA